MGQGGYLQILNATEQSIIITAVKSYQMKRWLTPGTVIDAGTMMQFYIEFDEIIIQNKHDDSGDADFIIGSDTSQKFHIHAEFPGDDPQLSVTSWNVSKYVRSPENISWSHNGTMSFAIGGK